MTQSTKAAEAGVREDGTPLITLLGQRDRAHDQAHQHLQQVGRRGDGNTSGADADHGDKSGDGEGSGFDAFRARVGWVGAEDAVSRGAVVRLPAAGRSEVGRWVAASAAMPACRLRRDGGEVGGICRPAGGPPTPGRGARTLVSPGAAASPRSRCRRTVAYAAGPSRVCWYAWSAGVTVRIGATSPLTSISLASVHGCGPPARSAYQRCVPAERPWRAPAVLTWAKTA